MGFGNPVRSDDGVGCYVVSELKKREPDADYVSLFDMGTSAFEVLFQLVGHQQIIIVDAVLNSNEPDGTLFRLPAAAIQSAIVNDPLVFLHSLKWDQALSYAKKILQNDYPEDNISVFLIAVSNTKLDIGMKQEVQAAGDKVVQFVLEDIHQFIQHGAHL